MATLAIRGHETRGKEVIEILEMLGGKKTVELCGNATAALYSIFNDRLIDYFNESRYNKNETEIFTLEEFLKKFPYKVGDKVTYDGDKANIVGMVWDNDINDVFYEIQVCDDVFKCPKVLLQPYKEEIMKEKLEQITLDIPDGYEFFGINDDNKVVLTKKYIQYPKTYEECCKIVNASPYVELVYNISDGHKYSYDEDNLQLYENIRRLKICRDAYWKIAGEEMGLGGPWTPELHEGFCYTARVINDELLQDAIHFPIFDFLSFPTEEVLREFVENFADIMIQTNKLLR